MYHLKPSCNNTLISMRLLPTASRSPWSNKYDPPIEDGFLPSEKLRNMELEFGELFEAYRVLYYEGGTSSVYLWDLDHGFAGCFLIKKSKRTPSFPITFSFSIIRGS